MTHIAATRVTDLITASIHRHLPTHLREAASIHRHLPTHLREASWFREHVAPSHILYSLVRAIVTVSVRIVVKHIRVRSKGHH